MKDERRNGVAIPGTAITAAPVANSAPSVAAPIAPPTFGPGALFLTTLLLIADVASGGSASRISDRESLRVSDRLANINVLATPVVTPPVVAAGYLDFTNGDTLDGYTIIGDQPTLTANGYVWANGETAIIYKDEDLSASELISVVAEIDDDDTTGDGFQGLIAVYNNDALDAGGADHALTVPDTVTEFQNGYCAGANSGASAHGIYRQNAGTTSSLFGASTAGYYGRGRSFFSSSWQKISAAKIRITQNAISPFYVDDTSGSLFDSVARAGLHIGSKTGGSGSELYLRRLFIGDQSGLAASLQDDGRQTITLPTGLSNGDTIDGIDGMLWHSRLDQHRIYNDTIDGFCHFSATYQETGIHFPLTYAGKFQIVGTHYREYWQWYDELNICLHQGCHAGFNALDINDYANGYRIAIETDNVDCYRIVDKVETLVFSIAHGAARPATVVLDMTIEDIGTGYTFDITVDGTTLALQTDSHADRPSSDMGFFAALASQSKGSANVGAIIKDGFYIEQL